MFSNMDFGGITKKLLLNLLVKVLGEFVELDENNLSIAIISGQVCLHNLKLRTENIFKKFNFHIFHGSLKTLEITIPWNLVGSAWKIKLEGILIDVGPPSPSSSTTTAGKDEGKHGNSSSNNRHQHPFGNWDSSANLKELLQKAMDEKMQKLKMIDEYLELSHGILTSEAASSTTNTSSTSSGLTGNINSESYIQQLTTRIIDNIEISLVNIHVRYEDSLAIPGNCFAAGITLEAFNISTCDEYWRPAFINNTDNGSSAACVKKLATLQSLGIYWEVQSESIAHLPFETWKTSMLEMIHTGIRPVSRPLNYILSPAGSGMYMKFTHFKRPIEGMPRFDIIAESNDMKFHIDNTQYQQLFHLLDKVKMKSSSSSGSNQFRDPNSFQPPERPLSLLLNHEMEFASTTSTSSAIAIAREIYHRKRMIRRWWQYGKNLIILRKKYVSLMKRKKQAQVDNQEIDHVLTRKEINELCSIEERLPLEVLKRFRQYALVEFYRENKHLRPKPASEKEKSSGGWFGWGSSGKDDSRNVANSNNDNAIDRLPIDEVVMKLDSMESEQSKKLFSSIKIQLSSSSTIILSTPTAKLLECKGAVTISLQKSSKLITFGCFLTDVSIVDGMGISSFHPHLLSVKPESTMLTTSSSSSTATPAGKKSASTSRRPGEFKPTLSVLIENLKGKTKISVSALPVELYLNKLCIQTLLGEFALPKKQINKLKKSVNVEKFDRETLETAIRAGTKYSSQAFKNMMKATTSSASLAAGSTSTVGGVSLPVHKDQGDGIEIVLDIHAPKIIIPEDCTKDAGFLLLDCGFLNVKGFIYSDGTMSFTTSLKKINAGLPLHIHDLYSLEDLSLYLIKPFDLNIQMQSTDQSLADMTVVVDVQPQVRGEVDAIKLARLLKIVNGVGETFTPKKRMTSTNSTATLPASVSADSLIPEPGTAPSTPLRAKRGDNDDSDLLHQELIIQPSLDAYLLDDDNNSEGFATPLRLSAATPTNNSGRDPSISNENGFFSSVGSARSPGTPAPDQRDPNTVSMHIEFSLPILALDLTYDHENNQHIVFTIEGLELDMINRTYDRKINFVMHDFSIEDSIRHESQRFVAWTPKDDNELINVAILMIQSKRSPWYRYHSLEMKVDFEDLRLNVDVPTVLHLKPFFDVLLDKKGKNNQQGNSPVPPQQQQPSSFGANSSSMKATRKSLVPFSSPDNQIDPSEIPTGTKIDARMKKFTVDILRPSYMIGEAGLILDTTFSMRMVDMRLDMNMMELMTTDLRLKTFEIVDIRNFSKDYIFKNLFCPTRSAKEVTTKMESSTLTDEISVASDAAREGIIFGQLGSFSEEVDGFVTEEHEDLLHLVFCQESKTHSLCNVMISGITSFVAIDAILDFAVLASSNFFTITGLFGSKDEENTPPAGGNRSSNANHAALNETNNTMNAVVTMVNSRLILLEDPAMNESRAIVGQCKLDVHYSKDTRITTPTSYAALIKGDTAPRVEVFESVHVTVSENEVFVLKSMKSWNPLPILEPFDVEFHFKRHLINGDAILTDVQAELEGIEARLSFNDLLLAHSILSRRSLAQEDTKRLPSGNTSNNSAPQPNATPLTRTSSLDFGQQPPAPSIIVRFGLTSMSVVVVNDFNATAIPVLRLLVGDTTFYAEGLVNNVQGEGSTQMKIDYFHSPILTWEPLLETWKPTCRISVEPMATIADIKSDHTVQLTVSGAMLETFLRSYTLFFHDYDISNTTTTNKNGDGKMKQASLSSSSDIMLHNCLGNDIDVDILDSNTKQRLLELTDGDCSDLTSALLTDSNNKKSAWIMKSFQKLPTAVDIVFKGSIANTREPLTFLPFNITKPKALTLQRRTNAGGLNNNANANNTANDSSTVEVSMKKTQDTKNNHQFIMEPIEEEVYQNCRYDPISGKWRKPYFLGDPYKFTDGSGLVRKDINSVEIHSDRWEWTGKWEVDMDGVVGIEIDEDGWEYATSFTFFSMVSPRRTFQALDGVRRRRWTRTRVPKLPLEIQQNRPLTVIWDVQTLKSGARKVLIRSGFQIVNDLDLDVWICLQHPIWQEEKVLGPVKAGESFNVPLLESFAAQIKFRPVMNSVNDDRCEERAGREREGQDGDYEWSGYYQCNLHSYDFKIVKDVSCWYKPFNNATSNKKGSDHYHYPIHFRAWTIRDNKMLTLRLVPYLVIRNKLLCNTNYRCSVVTNTNSAANTSTPQQEPTSQPVFEEVTETHAIQPGRVSKLRYINFVMSYQQQTEPTIAFQLGTFDWSVDYKISRSQGTNQLVALELKKVEDPHEVLPIVMQIKLNTYYSMEVDVFFKVAMIDRTGLNLCVKSLRSSGAGTSSTSISTRRGGRVELLRRFNAQGDEVFYPNAPWKNNDKKSTKDVSSKKYSPLKSSSRDNVVTTTTPPMGMKTIPSYDIENLTISSMHVYEVSRCDISTNVYSDAKFKWSHLPHCLRGQTGIKLPLADRYSRISNYLTFTLRQSALIFVLIDNKCHSLPWLHSEGYVKTPEIAVAKRVSGGHMLEMNYNIYGKYFESGTTVTCGGSWDRSSSFMYSVIIVTANEVNRLQAIQEEHDRAGVSSGSHSSSSIALALFHQIMHNKEFSLDLAGLCWTECCKNIMAFYSTDNFISVSTVEAARLGNNASNANRMIAGNEDAWSEEISIDTRTNSSTKGSFTIDCARNDISYQLSYTLENLPGLYQHTQIVTFMPRFVILNCIGEDEMLYVAQKGSHRHTEFAPYQPEGWHIIDPKFGFEVVLRTSSTTWSLGAVCLNEIGSTVLYIPYSNQDHIGSTAAGGNTSATRGLVLHVEVKVAEPTDYCSIIIVVWQETVESQGAMSINNDSDVPITIRQMNIELDHDLGEKEHLYELTVPPGRHIPFGWTDPDCGTDILVAVGYNLQPANQKRIARLNFLKHEQRMRLPFVHSASTTGIVVNSSSNALSSMANATGGGGGTGVAPSSYYDEVILNITTSDAGHVLHVSKSPSKSSHLHLPINENQEHHLIIPDHPPHLPSNSHGGSGSGTGHHPHHDDLNGSGAASTSQASNTTFQVIPLFGLNIFLSSLGISLIVEKPRRRELFSLYIDRMEIFVKAKGAMKTLEFSIMDLQLDNYSETMIYPILLRSTKKDFHRSVNYEDEGHPDHGPSSSLGDGSNGGGGDGGGQDNQDVNGIGGGISTMSDVEKPFIQLSIVQDQPRDSKRPILKYVAFRVLSLAIEVDSATIQLLFLDLLDDLKILTNNQILALNLPHRWLHDFNRDLLSPMMNRQSLIDIHYCKQLAQQNKMYIKNLIIHPMKVTVTLFQTTFQRPDQQSIETLQSTMLNALMSMVGVEKLQLRLSSFEVEDAMESTDTLVSLITTKAVQDLRSQLAQIAGSLAMIGSPIGFARKVGSGVKAFFYEPYLGAIHGSHDFVSGLRKGTTRLISGVVTGAMDSAVAFVGTASKGISYLSGDIDYVRTRAMRRQQQIAHVRNHSHAMSHRAASEGGFGGSFGGLTSSNGIGNHGIYSGFKYGGESFVTGITAGVAGLVSKPIEGAATGGVKGFIKGVGLGLLGAAVKPLVGLTEGLTSIAYGISSQVDPNSYKYQHVRPPRALEPALVAAGSSTSAAASSWLSLTSSAATGSHTSLGSSNDNSILIITPLNLESAYAQDFVMKRALQNHYLDHFLYYLPLGEVKGEAVILSEVYLFWRKTKSLWGRVWPNISHCVYVGEGVGIMLYSGACQGNTELVVIPCKSKTHLKALYTALARNAHRMGNPSKVLSPELIDWNANSHGSSSNLLATAAAAASTSFASSPRAKHFQPLPRSRSSSAANEPPASTKAGKSSGIDYDALVREANKVGELDGYRFGSVNGKSYGGGHTGSGGGVVGTEQDVIHRAQDAIHRGCRYWRQLDETIWQLIYDWGLAHTNLASCRCCATLIINHSDSPIQITRIQMQMGRQVVIMGSEATGYEVESRLIWSRGYVVVFMCAFPQSPLEVGHLKAKINSVAFTGIIASTQRETYCEAKSGFTIGFLEKSVSEWWSKYVIHIS